MDAMVSIERMGDPSGAAQKATGRGAQIRQRALGTESLDRVEELGVVADDMMQRRIGERAERRSADILEIAVVLDDILRHLREFLRIEKTQAGGTQGPEAARL